MFAETGSAAHSIVERANRTIYSFQGFYVRSYPRIKIRFFPDIPVKPIGRRFPIDFYGSISHRPLRVAQTFRSFDFPCAHKPYEINDVR